MSGRLHSIQICDSSGNQTKHVISRQKHVIYLHVVSILFFSEETNAFDEKTMTSMLSSDRRKGKVHSSKMLFERWPHIYPTMFWRVYNNVYYLSYRELEPES